MIASPLAMHEFKPGNIFTIKAHITSPVSVRKEPTVSVQPTTWLFDHGCDLFFGVIIAIQGGMILCVLSPGNIIGWINWYALDSYPEEQVTIINT